MIRLLKLQLIFAVYLVAFYSILDEAWKIYRDGTASINSFVWLIFWLFLAYLAYQEQERIRKG